MKKKIVLALENIGVKFGNKELFSGISGKITGGELLAVTGKNGAGKSTLVKVILGLTRPTEGAVTLTSDAKEILTEERRAFCGLVSPEIVLYSTLSAFENIAFISKIRGVNLTESEINQALSKTGLSANAPNRVAHYSTGMRQRLKLAAVMAVNSPIWLLDEPTSNLDDEGKNLVGEIIIGALDEKIAIVLATNNLEETKDAKTIIAL